MPKVSVIVPVYNVEKYLIKCLNSLVNQTLDDIEIIIVNDGSTDNSKEVIENFIKKYKDKKIVYLEKENGGLSDARNYGLKYAKGEYIAFLDSDDFVDKTIYEKMYNTAKKQNVDYVECDFYWSYPTKKDFKNKEDIGVRYVDKQGMILYARVVAWNKLIKRDTIREEFPFGLHYEDVEFFYKLIPYIKKVAFVEEPLIYYVQREDSLVNMQNIHTEDIFKVLQNVINFYKEKNLFQVYKEELEYTYARITLCSSFKRIKKIKDKKIKEQLLFETWGNLNTEFPKWKKNKYLKEKSLKNFYMKTINKFTFRLYSKI